jgi:hypothetical protein
MRLDKDVCGENCSSMGQHSLAPELFQLEKEFVSISGFVDLSGDSLEKPRGQTDRQRN